MESRNWIGGEWSTPKGGEMTVYNPSDTKQEIGVLHLSEVGDVLQAGEAARRALRGWAGLTGAQRGEHLYRLAATLEAHADEVATLASSEMGKPISEMRGEVTRGIHLLRYYAAEGVRAIGQVIPSTQAQVLQYTKRVPLGVVGIITPWNFPVAIPIWKIAPALICGNTVVWKPAETASLTATRLVELFAEAGLPGGVLNLVIGKGRTVGNALLEQVELDGVSFTGSTATGKHVAAVCASRNIKYQTEMGGKNAAIVLADADFKTTVPALLSGAFRSAGQKCTATSRIIVEKSVYDQLATALRDAVKDLYVGHALDPKSYLGPVASKDQFETVSSYVRMADQAEVVARGTAQVDPASGHYVLPTVVSGVGVDHPLIQEEIFGPVAALLPARDVDEAIELCNKTVYGLSAAIFTQDLSKAIRFLEEAEAGMVRVNLETAGVEYQAPFGGMKWSSSHTREQGQAALDFYSQVKTCAVYYGG
ncbi:MAG: aldehyde dehydrogenase family protein [Alicyclobacillus macrosporangiidus]|uniref:aldehyde dehydrogenase family protein n=1 Tax=Alicyclobacillus macrosporangiidus TaxID=392015 RepID=UPI0026ED66F7|nr:aldehyde dehydrogenase family protein [Alicyclobacillus macrosporangiidus]MCL6599473.1 aldehyde dehydrogenase family protein [Alicyclobacillus macrosporangiidus]